jgi:hypothetical protein
MCRPIWPPDSPTAAPWCGGRHRGVRRRSRHPDPADRAGRDRAEPVTGQPAPVGVLDRRRGDDRRRCSGSGRMPGARTGQTGSYRSAYLLAVFCGAASACCAPVLAVLAVPSGAPASLPVALAIGAVHVAGMVIPPAVIALTWEARRDKASRVLTDNQRGGLVHAAQRWSGLPGVSACRWSRCCGVPGRRGPGRCRVWGRRG